MIITEESRCEKFVGAPFRLFRTRSTKPVIIITAMITISKTFTIGNDLEVNRLGFGAMRLTGTGIWGEPKDPEEARRVLKRAVELGVNFIDTANSYGPEVSERLIGETLYPYPDDLVIATKGGLRRPGPSRWARWSSSRTRARSGTSGSPTCPRTSCGRGSGSPRWCRCRTATTPPTAA